MVMERLGFVRHGITDWNAENRVQGQTDIPLNEQGRSQARALAKRLGQDPWDVIYASDLARAKETAQIAGAALGLKVYTDKRLREVYYGKQEGTTLAERMAQYGDRHAQMDWGLESDEEVISRGTAAVADILANHPGRRILIFSHGELIEIMIPTLLKQPIRKNLLSNTALSILTHQNREWHCELFNCTKHLEEK